MASSQATSVTYSNSHSSRSDEEKAVEPDEIKSHEAKRETGPVYVMRMSLALDGDLERTRSLVNNELSSEKRPKLPSKLRQAMGITRQASLNSLTGKKAAVAPKIIPLSDLEKSIVGWESQEDPKMPLNFSSTRKWVLVWALAAISFMSPFSSSVLAPAIRYFNEEFQNTNDTKGPLPVSIYLLGYAVGPLFLAPLSEIYGRASVLTLSNVFFCLWHIGCALAPSLDFLIVFRFFSGVGGSGCMTLGGAVIGDLFPIEGRGVALSTWALGPLVGPTLGPLVGAFIAGSIGWRWAPWIVLIPSAVVTLVLALCLPETNHKVLMQRKVERVSRELSRTDLRSCYELSESAETTSQTAILRNGFLRPLKMLAFAPAILIQSLYVSFIHGTVYIMYNAIPPTFETEYGWDTGLTGLVFISIGLGYMAGLYGFSKRSDATVTRLTRANGGVFKPEFRLPIMVWYALVCPVSFFWYGWTAEKHVHWIVPVVGLFPLGFGVIGVFMPTQAYIIDAYPSYAASGIAAFTVLRSVVAAFLPMCGPALFGNIGLGWGNSVLGFICVAMIPVPIIIYKFGERLRERYPLKL